jgi:hypothetical protein
MAGVFGYQAKFGVGAASPVDKPLDIQNEGLVLVEEFADLNGMRGTRSRHKNRRRVVRQRVGGPVTIYPTSVELVFLLQQILGGAPSGTPQVFPLADALPTFYATADRVTKVFTYAGCAVDKAVFSARSGEPVSLTMDIVAQTETVAAAGSFPALTIDETTQPFIFSDLALVINAVTYLCKEFTLTLDNVIDKERFLNSLTLSSVQAQDRTIGLTTSLPYGDASAAYGAGASGVAATATFTDGGTSLAFAMPALQWGKTAPAAGGRGEIFLPINAMAMESAAAGDELTATLDSTP